MKNFVKHGIKYVILVIAYVLLGLGAYWIMLPPINLCSAEFWFFIGCDTILNSAIIYLVLFFIDGLFDSFIQYGCESVIKKILLAAAIVIAATCISLFITSPLFFSKTWNKRVPVTPVESGIENIPTLSENGAILIDHDSAIQLGSRQLGTMSDKVSQFNIAETYSIQTVNGETVRISPLKYRNIFTIKGQTIAGYIKVNVSTGNTEFVDCEITVSPSAIVKNDLKRTIRRKYPTILMDSVSVASFEVDDNGHPYWIVPTYTNKLWINCSTPSGVILVSAEDGNDVQYYDLKDVPQWVDGALNSYTISRFLNDYASYSKGFFNSFTRGENVWNLTKGCGYVTSKDGQDILMYSGITSVGSDESNIGFILTNMRTGETNIIRVPSCEEYSAMATAEGAIQEKGYKSSFPVLYKNNNDNLIFIEALKDNAGLIKAYAAVNAQNYNEVVVSSSFTDVVAKANSFSADATISEIKIPSSYAVKNIVVEEVATAVVNGFSIFYIKDTNGVVYTASIESSKELPFIKSGYTIEANVDEYNNIISNIISCTNN